MQIFNVNLSSDALIQEGQPSVFNESLNTLSIEKLPRNSVTEYLTITS